MTTESPDTGQQLRSLVTPDGTLELSLLAVPIGEPKPNEVVIRVEAAPINPSDLGLLFAGADMGSAKVSGPAADPVVTASIPAAAMRALAHGPGPWRAAPCTRSIAASTRPSAWNCRRARRRRRARPPSSTRSPPWAWWR